MAGKTPYTEAQRDHVLALWEKHGNLSEVERQTGVSRQTIRRIIAASGHSKPIASGALRPRVVERFDVPKKGVRRYIVTSAQNNTYVHRTLLDNLLTYAKYRDARLLIGTFSYNQNSFGKLAVKRGKSKRREEELWYDPVIETYILDSRVQLAPGLQWCGEMNILPTAVNPISGLESYTGRDSSIFPHAKIALESIISGKYEGTKFCYTTGTVTQRNYIAKKAGMKADFHHSYGALIVEVDSDGDWFVRQLSANDKGEFSDLGCVVQKGKVTTGHRIEAINYGDLHVIKLEPSMFNLCWGKHGIFQTLKPRHQFCHDTLDFYVRNHHDWHRPLERFKRHLQGPDNVEAEIEGVAKFLTSICHPSCKTIVVESNHDNALGRWLDEADYKHDPENALFFLEAQLRRYRAIMNQEDDFHLAEWAIRRAGAPKAVRFLRTDESYIICRDSHGGIESGMHGHLGPNGARGSSSAFARMGRKVNMGHEHSARIINGVYVSGVTAPTDLGYNYGPSSWSQSHIITYISGKRAILTCWNGKWRAQ